MRARCLKRSPICQTPSASPLEPKYVFFFFRVWHETRCPLDQYRGRLIPSRRCGKTAINKYVSNPLRAVARCLRLCPLSPSLSGSLLIDSQSMSTFFRRRCELLHCHHRPPTPLLKCADELTRSRQIRTCYLKSGGRGALINLRGPRVALCCCIMHWKKCSYQDEREAALRSMNTCLAG